MKADGPRRGSRRRFLAQAAAGGAAGLALAPVARAQGPVWLRFQSAWPAKHLFYEYALDFAKKVNDMTGGDLRIEMMPLGSVVSAFGLLDAVSAGKLDGAHGALVNHYGKQPAVALWGSGPAFGMDGNMLLAWHKYGGGKELLAKLYASLGAAVVSFLYGPQPAQPLGWFKQAISKPEDFRGLRFRTDGMAIALFGQLGALVNPLPEADTAASMAAGLLDGAELSNAAVDRAAGLAAAAKVCMLQSYHQTAEQFEILIGKAKFEALPAKLRAIIENAVEAASQDIAWKSIERYSRAYSELRANDAVTFYRTPDAVLRRQLTAYDAVVSKRKGAALFQEIEKSQRAFAGRAVRWRLDTAADSELAYRHYFSDRAVRPPPNRKK
jgi:TRAP-type mannitol/chloroaromatic compound transport system substrate-binding protein